MKIDHHRVSGIKPRVGMALRAVVTRVTIIRRVFGTCAFLLAVAFLSPAAAAPPAKPSPSPAANANGRQTYDSFRLIHVRNVFDPDRRPPRPANAPAPAAAPTRTDYVVLTGIAMDGEKSLAFFSGSRADFNKVISTGEQIAGAKVSKITPMSIEVERKSRHLTVAVGQTVPLDDKSAPGPAPAEASDAPAGATPADNHAATASASPAPGSSPAPARPPRPPISTKSAAA